jgi:small subunit ribosomal protein S4
MLIEKKCKICRSLGQKILWNNRCASNKCALSRRRTRPGMHGAKPRVLSDYGRSLIEKQKIKFYYVLKEKQLKRLVEEAEKMKEPTPQALIKLLESKLDNVIWRLGYTDSKLHAKQLVSHGHFLVNGKRVKSSFIFLSPGDVIEIRPQSKDIEPFKNLHKKFKIYTPPPWLRIDVNTLKGEFLRYPEPEELNLPFNVPLALQFYSK